MLSIPEIVSWRALMDTKKAIFSVLESCFQIDGYTVPRFQILFYLYFNGPLGHKELGILNQFTKGNTTTFLKRMLTDSLIEEIKGHTNNRTLYQLSKKGLKEFEKLFPRHVQRVKSLILPFNDDFLLLLERIRQNIPTQKDKLLTNVSEARKKESLLALKVQNSIRKESSSKNSY